MTTTQETPMTTETETTMATVTRTIVREPSNSKCPGATRHLSIGGERFRLGVAEVPAGPATIKIGGSFSIGSGRTARLERKQVEIPVIVTGDEADEVLGVLDGGSQGFTIRFRGVRRVEN